MSKRTYYFIIGLGILGTITSVVVFFLNQESNFGTSALMFFNGVALSGVGYINLKKKGR